MSMIQGRVALGALICVLALWSASVPARAEDWSGLSIADAHLHLLDFLQNGDYLEDGKLVEKSPGQALASGERGKRIAAVLWAMDRANVGQALVTGMPFLKKWSQHDPFRPGYYLDSSSRMVGARDTDYHLALAIEDYRKAGGRRERKQLKRIYACVGGALERGCRSDCQHTTKR